MPRDDDDQPWKRDSRNQDDDDEDDRPRRRRRRRDEDDDEDDDFDYDPRPSRGMRRSELRAIANYQKGIIVCILLNICLFAASFMMEQEDRIYLLIGYVPIALVSLACVFMLATTVYGTAVGVILGVLILLPCIGLIVLLIVNQKATSILKSHGIHVGLFGANTSRI